MRHILLLLLVLCGFAADDRRPLVRSTTGPPTEFPNGDTARIAPRQGLFSAIGAPASYTKCVYIATDTNQMYFSDGVSWIPVGSSGIGYNVKDPEFGAVGDGTSRPLSAPDAAAYNTAFSVYGAQGAYAIVAGDERDWAASQCAMWKAANTGENVYFPPGLFRMGSKTLRLSWTATPITGQPARPILGMIYGSGHDSSQLAWDNLPANGVSVELLGRQSV